MFMKDDKKKNMAALIIAKKKDPESSEEEMMNAPKNEDGDNSDYDMGLDTAAEDMLAAIESKDKQALKSSAKALVQMIMDEAEDMERANPEED